MSTQKVFSYIDSNIFRWNSWETCECRHLEVFGGIYEQATVNHICKSFELSECRRGLHMMTQRLPTEMQCNMMQCNWIECNVLQCNVSNEMQCNVNAHSLALLVFIWRWWPAGYQLPSSLHLHQSLVTALPTIPKHQNELKSGVVWYPNCCQLSPSRLWIWSKKLSLIRVTTRQPWNLT